MNYPDADSLIQSFRATYWLITHQARSVTHEESLLQLPFRANCMNWIVGHLVMERDFVLTLLGEEPVWAEEEYLLYRTNSKPILPGSKAVRFEKILKDLEISQQRILGALERLHPERLESPASIDGKDGPISTLIAGYHWHETYHCGQLEILRQLAGKDDKVV